ncbi:hypothetical protein GCM10007987_25670 [Aliivibrio fischeri]|nr:hypothetical protein GCM10007987_25670 [Aliivibrio fischeri]
MITKLDNITKAYFRLIAAKKPPKIPDADSPVFASVEKRLKFLPILLSLLLF